jgi:hypothetical protein
MRIKDIFGDSVQQQEGVWVEFQPGVTKGDKVIESPVQFKLAFSGAKDPQNYFIRRLSKSRRKMRRGELPAEVTQAITLDMLVEHIVLGWSGIEDNDGKLFEYSKENCRVLLEGSVQLRDFVASEASDVDNFGGKLGSEGEETAEGATKSVARGNAAVEA